MFIVQTFAQNPFPFEKYDSAFRECYTANDQECIIKVYNQMISDYPKRSEPLLNKGFFLYEMKRYEESIHIYTIGIELEKDSIKLKDLYLHRGNSFYLMGKQRKAEKDYKKANQYSPNDDALKLSMCQGLIDKKNFKEALDLLKSVSDSNELPHAYNNIGFCYQKMELHDSAISYFDKTLHMLPNHDIALSNKSYSLYKINKVSEALKAANKSIGINGNNAYAYRNRAIIYLFKGDENKACHDLHKAQMLKFELSYGNECKKLIKKHCK